MAEENKVILHGLWASPYVKGVELALRIKGIPFNYVEEDINNKSPLLLKYNPIYKKVPVLVHNGKPISESLIIIQYIDETWKNDPPLLPKDPYKRAQSLFWAAFLQQLFDATLSVLKTHGEAQQRALLEVAEKLNHLERGLKDLVPEGNRFVKGGHMGLLDIVICSFIGSYKFQEQVLEIVLIDPDKHPLIVSRLSALAEHPIVKEATPPKEKTLALLRWFRQKALQSSAA